MHIFDKTNDDTVARRSAAIPRLPQPNSESEPRPCTLTCLEDRAAFEQLRAAVYAHFAPADFFEQCVADELAEELWMKRRFSDVANQALSLEIESSFEKVSQSHPGADHALRTVLAWKDFDKDPACRNALAQRTRSGRDFLNLSRHIASTCRHK